MTSDVRTPTEHVGVYKCVCLVPSLRKLRSIVWADWIKRKEQSIRLSIRLLGTQPLCISYISLLSSIFRQLPLIASCTISTLSVNISSILIYILQWFLHNAVIQLIYSIFLLDHISMAFNLVLVVRFYSVLKMFLFKYYFIKIHVTHFFPVYSVHNASDSIDPTIHC